MGAPSAQGGVSEVQQLARTLAGGAACGPYRGGQGSGVRVNASEGKAKRKDRLC